MIKVKNPVNDISLEIETESGERLTLRIRPATVAEMEGVEKEVSQARDMIIGGQDVIKGVMKQLSLLVFNFEEHESFLRSLHYDDLLAIAREVNRLRGDGGTDDQKKS